jgi:hypothetical protein
MNHTSLYIMGVFAIGGCAGVGPNSQEPPSNYSGTVVDAGSDVGSTIEASATEAGSNFIDATPIIETSIVVDAAPMVIDATPIVDTGVDVGTTKESSTPNQCPNNLTYCSGEGACVDLSASVNSCGACGNICPAPQNSTGNNGTIFGYATCANGICGTSCEDNGTLCNNQCVNLSGDKNNCGSCGNVCQTYANIIDILPTGQYFNPCVPNAQGEGQCIPPNGFANCQCIVGNDTSYSPLTNLTCSYQSGANICAEGLSTNINLMSYYPGCTPEPNSSELSCPNGSYLYACITGSSLYNSSATVLTYSVMTSPQCTALTGGYVGYYCCQP